MADASMPSQPKTCAPLEGVRVLDLTRAVTGPFCTMLLGDLGARIIKIEEPGNGDETRQWGPPFVEGESAYFLALNRNKESVVLDLKRECDLAVLRRLASESDVVAQNFRPGVVERLGVDYESLKNENPDLIYASISGFGLTGPDCQRPGYDLIVQAMSGMMVASGWEGMPAKACFPVADILAGQFASQAILAALYERERTGKGAQIEVSLLEALLFAMPSQSMGCLLTGSSPPPQGTATAMIAPYQLLECRDAALAVAVPNERIWRRFCDALGRPEWADEERYRTNQRRIENRAGLIEQIEAVMRGHSSAEWQAILGPAPSAVRAAAVNRGGLRAAANAGSRQCGHGETSGGGRFTAAPRSDTLSGSEHGIPAASGAGPTHPGGVGGNWTGAGAGSGGGRGPERGRLIVARAGDHGPAGC